MDTGVALAFWVLFSITSARIAPDCSHCPKITSCADEFSACSDQPICNPDNGICFSQCDDGSFSEDCDGEPTPKVDSKCSHCPNITACDDQYSECPDGPLCNTNTGVCFVLCADGSLREKCDKECSHCPNITSCDDTKSSCKIAPSCNPDTGACFLQCADGSLREKCDSKCSHCPNITTCDDTKSSCKVAPSCNPATGACFLQCTDGSIREKCDSSSKPTLEAKTIAIIVLALCLVLSILVHTLLIVRGCRARRNRQKYGPRAVRYLPNERNQTEITIPRYSDADFVQYQPKRYSTLTDNRQTDVLDQIPGTSTHGTDVSGRSRDVQIPANRGPSRPGKNMTASGVLPGTSKNRPSSTSREAGRRLGETLTTKVNIPNSELKKEQAQPRSLESDDSEENVYANDAFCSNDFSTPSTVYEVVSDVSTTLSLVTPREKIVPTRTSVATESGDRCSRIDTNSRSDILTRGNLGLHKEEEVNARTKNDAQANQSTKGSSARRSVSSDEFTISISSAESVSDESYKDNFIEEVLSASEVYMNTNFGQKESNIVDDCTDESEYDTFVVVDSHQNAGDNCEDNIDENNLNDDDDYTVTQDKCFKDKSPEYARNIKDDDDDDDYEEVEEGEVEGNDDKEGENKEEEENEEEEQEKEEEEEAEQRGKESLRSDDEAHRSQRYDPEFSGKETNAESLRKAELGENDKDSDGFSVGDDECDSDEHLTDNSDPEKCGGQINGEHTSLGENSGPQIYQNIKFPRQKTADNHSDDIRNNLEKSPTTARVDEVSNNLAVPEQIPPRQSNEIYENFDYRKRNRNEHIVETNQNETRQGRDYVPDKHLKRLANKFKTLQNKYYVSEELSSSSEKEQNETAGKRVNQMAIDAFGRTGRLQHYESTEKLDTIGSDSGTLSDVEGSFSDSLTSKNSGSNYWNTSSVDEGEISHHAHNRGHSENQSDDQKVGEDRPSEKRRKFLTRPLKLNFQQKSKNDEKDELQRMESGQDRVHVRELVSPTSPWPESPGDTGNQFGFDEGEFTPSVEDMERIKWRERFGRVRRTTEGSYEDIEEGSDLDHWSRAMDTHIHQSPPIPVTLSDSDAEEFDV